jgi:hypothetical protein
MKKKRTGLYHALVVLPDHCYPFKTEIEGQWVRGVRSYNATLARVQREYGAGHYGFKLDAYRQIFHLAGSIFFLVVAAYLSQTFFRSPYAIYTFLVAALFLVTFQEFYLHRRMYRQLWRKGFVDWLAWCIPIGVYFFTHFH